MRYSILDPTGNITALVESQVPIEHQPSVAHDIMVRHPEVEQVGFMQTPSAQADDTGTQADGMEAQTPDTTLRMAGGEFCGNASMCAAALCALRRDEAGEKASADCAPANVGAKAFADSTHANVGEKASADSTPANVSGSTTDESTGLHSETPEAPQHDTVDGQSSNNVPDTGNRVWETMLLKVSGASQLVGARLQRTGAESFLARIHMPAVSQIEMRALAFNNVQDELPVVFMEGISHIVIQDDSPLYSLSESPFDAEQAVCAWCHTLHAEGLGLMFLQDEGDQLRLTPLVYVPGSDTVFWENSCASGSAAVGSYLASKTQAPVTLALNEPGGTLYVQSNPHTGTTLLQGSVRYVGSFSL